MTAKAVRALPIEDTEHPHVARAKGVCGGRPIIRGTRISVCHIAQLYKAGDSVEEILQAHPHLKATAVYDAISYYLDHQDEIEQEIAENRIEALMDKHGMEMDEHGFLRFTDETASES